MLFNILIVFYSFNTALEQGISKIRTPDPISYIAPEGGLNYRQINSGLFFSTVSVSSHPLKNNTESLPFLKGE